MTTGPVIHFGKRLPARRAVADEHPDIPFRQIAIEGAPRCQKTKLAQILSQMIGGRLVLDRPENPYLNDFYNEKDGASFLAQLVFLVNRYHQQLRLSQRDLFEERVISDYLFEKDKIYAYQTLGDDELVVYERIYGILSERIPRPDAVVYLQISQPTLLKRIAREGKLGREVDLREIPGRPRRGVRLFLLQLSGHAAAHGQGR